MSEQPKIAPGSICHVEIPAPDMAKATAFYGDLFGWKMTPMGDSYTVFGHEGLGGGLDKDAPVGDGGAVLVIAVDDITAKLAEIDVAGGEELSPKHAIAGGEHGYCAYFRDPNGNKVGLWSMT